MDLMLQRETFKEMEYFAIECFQKPDISFSGLFYPEFDFQGRGLQDIANPNCKFSLITFCSAPTDKGWAVVFAWHRDDSAICRKFIDSLTSAIDAGGILSDCILGLVIATTENVAFSPDWWESLQGTQREHIVELFTSNYDPSVEIDPSYLTKRVANAVSWHFEKFHTNM